MGFSAGIAGVGSYFPPRSVSNQELEKLRPLQTSDEWITTKLGIKHRRFARTELALSDLCIPAAKKAISDAGIKPQDIDIIIVGAMSHDYPASVLTGNIIKEAIGAHRAYAIDVNIICAGAVYCLDMASSYIESGRAETVLVVNGEIFAKYPQSRVTSVIFGDGAGACVLKRVPSGYGLLASYIRSKREGAEDLGIFVGGSREMLTREVQDFSDYFIHMNGRPIYEFAVSAFPEAVRCALEKAGIKLADVKFVFSHQANLNIIKEGMSALGLSMDKTRTNIQKYGNIGGGSVVTVLDDALKKGLINRGDVIVTVAFGSGLAWGSNVIRWY